jgi:hypothetical protein
MRQPYSPQAPRNPFMRLFVRVGHDSALLLRRAYVRLRYRPAKAHSTRIRRLGDILQESQRNADAIEIDPTPHNTLSPTPNTRLSSPSPNTPSSTPDNTRQHATLGEMWGALRTVTSRQTQQWSESIQQNAPHAYERMMQATRNIEPAQIKRLLVGTSFVALPLLLAMVLPILTQSAVHLWHDVQARLSPQTHSIAPFFAPSVQHWRDDIVTWAHEHNLDPNLLATVMQIESCGHPTVASHAGAQGLFQVMPFHFEVGEDMTDPATNAYRGASYLAFCLDSADGDAGLAMACYNGGASVLNRSFGAWANETRRYYLWGTGMYREAQTMPSESVTLNSWQQAGGARLCQMASEALNAG